MSITKPIETEAELWGYLKELEGPSLPPAAIAVENWIEIEYNPLYQTVIQACVNAVNEQWFKKGYR
ncbi:hypothetical protein OEK97_28390, partial [Escherichia coli]|uniref:hypothetical protein n=1 Tax=Escherichia coli TaxID=562 RepID=UPI0021DA41A4